MKASVSALPVLLCIALAACASTADKVEQKEDLLLASGFTIRPATTPQREALLHKLPAHHFVQRTKNGKAVFLYADPLVCDCLYVGTQQAYDRYRSNQLAQHLASEQQLAALTYDNAAWSWNAWGPWGLPDSNFGFVYGPIVGW